MTEDEAKNMICCGAPVVAHAAIMVAEGVSDKDTRPFLCRAAECMAWRPVTRTEYRWKFNNALLKEGERFGPGQVSEISVAGGYCGLAGTPRGI